MVDASYIKEKKCEKKIEKNHFWSILFQIISILFYRSLKITRKTLKSHIKRFFSFFITNIRMEQLRQKNAQKINLNRTLGAVNALSGSEKRKREHNIIKDILIFLGKLKYVKD